MEKLDSFKMDGTRYETKEGYTAIIVNYTTSKEVYIIFEGFEEIMKPMKVEMCQLRRKTVKNPYHRTVYGVGYIGQGKYKTSINGKQPKYYKHWQHMLERCYGSKFQEERSTYKDCFANEETHCLQNFGMWFDENYYEVNGERMHLDKDILVKGNKEYSFDKMIFVPEHINTLFVKQSNKRNNLPIGVSYHKRDKVYQAYCSTLNGLKYLGTYNTPKEAFLVYKQFKEAYIKEVADEYKGRIPDRLYEAMYRYKIEITD